MSGLDDLTREELIELVVKLYGTVQCKRLRVGFSTPSVRYYTYRHSRGSVVARQVLGEEFCGALVTERMPSERMAGFIGELFTFVAKLQVPSENNAAERAIRPAVVARKISGGSRSERGTKTCSLPGAASSRPGACRPQTVWTPVGR